MSTDDTILSPDDKDCTGHRRGREDASGRTVERALTLLEALEAQPQLSLAGLARSAGLTPTTASRLLAVLESRRFVRRDPDTKQYMLGFRTFELARSVGARLGLRALARPGLERLAEATDDTAYLVIADRDEITYIDKVDGGQFLQTRSHIGGRSPMHCTAVGKAILAHWHGDRLQRFLARELAQYTAATITTADALAQELAGVRRRGYAMNRQEYHPGAGGLAAPVFDGHDEVTAAVGLAGAIDRFAPARIGRLADAVMSTARELSLLLGAPTDRFVTEDLAAAESVCPRWNRT